MIIKVPAEYEKTVMAVRIMKWQYCNKLVKEGIKGKKH